MHTKMGGNFEREREAEKRVKQGMLRIRGAELFSLLILTI